MFGFNNPGAYYGPAQALAAYKNIECSVAGGTAVVSVNKYRNANNPPEKGGCQTAIKIKDALRYVASDVWERAGGQIAYMDVFTGKGSPAGIAGVLEAFVAHADGFIATYGKSKGAEGQCAALLADDSLSWQAALQKICDLHIGLDCNGFVGNWLKVVQPDFKLNQNSKSNDVRAKQKHYRNDLSEIEYWDVMCYVKNEHIAAIDGLGSTPGRFMVCQSAGGGPRMNELQFRQTGRDQSGRVTYKLGAPTKDDIGNDFYVVSLW
jgi:hypothetical protein